MNRNPDFERVKKTLFLEEPDRVPIAEIFLDQVFKEEFMGKQIESLKNEIDFWVEAGYDFVVLNPVYQLPERKTKEGKYFHAVRNDYITDYRDLEEKRKEEWPSEITGVISSEEDFERYPWPKIDEIDFSIYDRAEKIMPKGMKIIVRGHNIFALIMRLMGFEHFCYTMIDNPRFINRIFQRVGQLQIDLIKRAVQYDIVGAIWHADDIAYSGGPMVSPNFIRKNLFPWLKEISLICRENNLPLIFHSDGNVSEFIDDLISIGINALHPIEPKVMDINQIHKRYHGKLALIGNIEVDTLTRGTPGEVAREIRERIRCLAPGGGYCVGSSNSVTYHVPLGNYKAMIETTFRYGKYPIED